MGGLLYLLSDRIHVAAPVAAGAAMDVGLLALLDGFPKEVRNPVTTSTSDPVHPAGTKGRSAEPLQREKMAPAWAALRTRRRLLVQSERAMAL